MIRTLTTAVRAVLTGHHRWGRGFQGVTMECPILLVVTNDDALAEEIRNILELMQYDHVYHRTGYQDLFRATEECAPDMVVFDLDTASDPDILCMAEKLRARYNVPLLFIMNERDVRMMHTAWEAEPYGYIFKPLRSAIVIAEIDTALHRSLLEQKLEKSQEMFRVLFLNMSEGVAIQRLVCDNTGKPVNYEIIEVNPLFERIFGVSRENALGKMATAVYRMPEPPFLEEYAAVDRTGRTARLELFFPPLEKYFSASIAKMGDGFFATIFFDITERVRTQVQVSENEKRMRTLFRETPAYIFEVGRDLRIITMNKVPPDWKAEDIIGRRITEFMTVLEQEKLELVIGEVFDKNALMTYEGTLTGMGMNEPVEIVSRIAPLSCDGEILSALIVFWDVSSKK